jgi:ParB family transcriptional regulator, chromosome partitioning protein
MTTSAAEKLPPAENGPVEAPGTGPEITEKAAEKRRALGRGLDSLLPSGPRAVTNGVAAFDRSTASQEVVIGDIQAQAARTSRGDEIMQIELARIEHNPYQTRYFFDKEMLEELAESIRANGVVQPIVVRPGTDGKYLLILGERRCRASKLAGMTTIPAIVRRVSEQVAAEMTIVENLQRQDLNCLEQASAFAQLSQKFGLTQEQIGQRVGMARETVSNYMRLMKLPGTVLDYLQHRQLGFSEARTLLRLENNEEIATIADEAVKKNMSFIQLDDLVDGIVMKRYEYPQEKQARGARWVDPNVRAAQTQLQRVLGVKVKIRDRKGKGKIVIEYASLEDFDRVVGMLKGE